MPIHLVGGAVRDAARGRPVHDLDLVVADQGPAIAARLAAATGARLVALGGERFGALRLVSGARHIDIWDLQGGSLIADLWRRDFTVNAIALAVPGGAVTDPTGGIADLEKQQLRATRAEVFAEDPVRVLRLARLATTLPGWKADPATVASARAATPLLAAMPHERLRVELETLFSQARLSPAAQWFDDLDLGPFSFGQGAVAVGVARSTLPAAERLDRWWAGRTPAGDASHVQAPATRGSPLALHWTLFAELFSASRTATAAHLRAVAKRGLMTRDWCDAAVRLLAPGWQPPEGEVACRLWLHAAGGAWRDALALRATLTPSATVRRRVAPARRGDSRLAGRGTSRGPRAAGTAVWTGCSGDPGNRTRAGSRGGAGARASARRSKGS